MGSVVRRVVVIVAESHEVEVSFVLSTVAVVTKVVASKLAFAFSFSSEALVFAFTFAVVERSTKCWKAVVASAFAKAFVAKLTLAFAVSAKTAFALAFAFVSEHAIPSTGVVVVVPFLVVHRWVVPIAIVFGAVVILRKVVVRRCG